jgi:hypothetical protein
MPQADRRLWLKTFPTLLLRTMGGCETVNGSWLPSNIKLSIDLFMVEGTVMNYN